MRRRHVLFLPYQASMWDSMHTIWEAARRDPSVDVKVMSTPFVTFDRDGQPVEGAAQRYPQKVAISPWSPDILTTWPDVTYVHNPYDGVNLVTRVDPAAFTENLTRGHAHVVYVPYFVTAGWLDAGHRALPSYAHVDAIVLPTERMARQIDPAFRSKVVVLGSPKIDLAVREEDESTALADRVVEQGTIQVLVNISIGSLLTHGEAFLGRLAQLVGLADARQDTLLLWRPHPLLADTLESMRPSLVASWKALEQRVRDSAAVIMDSSSDATATIHTADCYMGDPASSLVALFGATGKPIFTFTDRMGLGEAFDDTGRPLISSMWVEDNQAFFTDQRLDILGRVDLRTGKCRSIAVLSDAWAGDRPRGRVMRIGERILCAPMRSTDLAIVDPATGSVVNATVGDGESVPFADMVVWNGHAVLLPHSHPNVVDVDPATLETSTWSDWWTHCAASGSGPWVHAHGGFLDGDVLVLASARSLEIYFLNLATGKRNVLEVSSEPGGFDSITQVSGHLIAKISGRAGFISVRMRDLHTAVIEDSAAAEAGVRHPYSRLTTVGSRLLAVPFQGDSVALLDPETSSISYLPLEAFGIHDRKPPGLFEGRTSAVGQSAAGVHFQDMADRAVVTVATDGAPVRLDLSWADAPTPPHRPLVSLFRPDPPAIPWAVRENGVDATPADFLDYVGQGLHDRSVQQTMYAEWVGPTDGRVGARIHDHFSTPRRGTRP